MGPCKAWYCGTSTDCGPRSFEGISRQATVYNGRNRDNAWYAAIDAEWPELEQAFLAWFAPDNLSYDRENFGYLCLLKATIKVITTCRLLVVRLIHQGNTCHC